MRCTTSPAPGRTPGPAPEAARTPRPAAGRGRFRLLPWEAKLLGAVCGGFLALYRKLQRPLSNVWFWLVLAGVLVLGIWATWPAGAWLSAGMVLGVFFVQVVLVGYLYLRWLIGMLVARR